MVWTFLQGRSDAMSTTEEALAKSGPELFKELLRIYPVAEVEDYWKNGVWKDELMRADLQLIEAHRKEAGAPEPPALEDVVMPPMPKATAATTFGSFSAPAFNAAASLAVPATGTPATAGTAVAELRLIALFVAKWKLEPTQSKALLAKMLPHRRRYVIQHFKTTVEGEDATKALEEYIAECEKSNAWGNAPPVQVAVAPRPIAPRPVALGTPLMSVGVKRPLSAIMPLSGVFDPNKRLRPTMPTFGAIRPATYPLFRASSPAFGLAPQPVQSLASRLAGAVRGPGATVRPLFASQGRPVQSLSFASQPRMITPIAARPLSARPFMARPVSAYPRPVAAAPQTVRPLGQFRPQVAYGAPRPVSFGGQIRPVPAGTQHGSLIRSLLQRY